MVAARIGKGGYIRQIAGYNTSEDDARIRCVSWAIFEVSWGKTKHRDTQELEDLSRARMTMTRVCVYITSDKSMFEILLVSLVKVKLAWPSSAPVTRLMCLQAMGTRHVIALHQNLQEFPHTKPAFYNTGSTR